MYIAVAADSVAHAYETDFNWVPGATFTPS